MGALGGGCHGGGSSDRGIGGAPGVAGGTLSGCAVLGGVPGGVLAVGGGGRVGASPCSRPVTPCQCVGVVGGGSRGRAGGAGGGRGRRGGGWPRYHRFPTR